MYESIIYTCNSMIKFCLTPKYGRKIVKQMKKVFLIFPIVAMVAMVGCNNQKTKTMSTDNPFFSEYDTPFQVPPFDKIKIEHYMPAFEKGMEEQNKAIDEIIANKEEPTFENTIVALENSGELLDKVGSVFYNLTSANTNDEMQKISKELAPKMTQHSDNIMLNDKLFEKVKQVYDNQDKFNLDTEQKVLLDRTYQGFVRGGANLTEEQKAEFRKINEKLSNLYQEFKAKLLAENNSFQVVVDSKDELKGLPENAIAAAAELAKEQGVEGKFVFTIHKPSLLPVLENCDNRELREKLFKGYVNKGDNNNQNDTKKIIVEIANTRLERAKLLGYKNHSDFILERNMAKNTKNVYDLLNKLMPNALKIAKQEVADMQKMADAENAGITIEPWDYWYYATKVKEQKYALNENQIRPYLKLDNVREGMFWTANQLYGLTFTPLNDMPLYHKDNQVFEVKEADGKSLGVLYLDYHPRASKRSGAWCTTYREPKFKNGKRVNPVVSMVCNFSAPVGDTPSLLSSDEAQTLFHEFGHALDNFFSQKHYASLGTPRDYVEMPSQVLENWSFHPTVLNHYAKHYQTGEPMPKELIEKIENAGKFNQGFATTEYLAAAILDMDWHSITEPITMGANEFEKQSTDRMHLIKEIVPRYRSTYFQHIFAGTSYSSGYYSYIWSEVLDADAFEAFQEKGIFDQEIAKKFRRYLLELGGMDDPMNLYIQFRGREPKIQPLLERRGLE